MFWSTNQQNDQNKHRTISQKEIEQLQFYQLIGIPIPALVLGFIGLKICFVSQCGLAQLPDFSFWKLLSVWALSSGALLIYSIDFIWDCRDWKRKGHNTKVFWTYVSWGWLVLSLISWLEWYAFLVRFLGWDECIELMVRLLQNHHVQILLFSLVLYGLIISVLKQLKWLMVMILPLVVAMSITFPIYSYPEYIKEVPIEFQRVQVWDGSVFPVSIFAILSLNVLLVQRFEIPKDQTLNNYNIWINLPKVAQIMWWLMVLLFLITSIWNVNTPLFEVTWGEWLIVLMYLGMYGFGISVHPRFGNAKYIAWLKTSGYRFLIDFLLLGMILK